MQTSIYMFVRDLSNDQMIDFLIVTNDFLGFVVNFGTNSDDDFVFTCFGANSDSVGCSSERQILGCFAALLSGCTL